MKLLLTFVSLVTLTIANPTGWQEIKSPLEHPRFQEVLKKIYMQRNPNEVKLSGRIVGGSLASLGQFPYQAYVYLNDLYLCGGSAITSTFILTAAHCLDKMRKAEVFIGGIDRSVPSPWTTTVEGPNNLIIHEAYDASILINDIALIRTPVIPLNGGTIGLVTLPLKADQTYSLDNNRAIVSGFGRFSDKSQSASAQLRYVEVPILPNNICAGSFGQIIRDTNVCIDATGGKGACNGDSGGPLTSEINGRIVQIGIVSFGAAAGCELGYPVVFTRVTEYLDWIEQKTGN